MLFAGTVIFCRSEVTGCKEQNSHGLGGTFFPFSDKTEAGCIYHGKSCCLTPFSQCLPFSSDCQMSLWPEASSSLLKRQHIVHSDAKCVHKRLVRKCEKMARRPKTEIGWMWLCVFCWNFELEMQLCWEVDTEVAAQSLGLSRADGVNSAGHHHKHIRFALDIVSGIQTVSKHSLGFSVLLTIHEVNRSSYQYTSKR